MSSSSPPDHARLARRSFLGMAASATWIATSAWTLGCGSSDAVPADHGKGNSAGGGGGNPAGGNGAPVWMAVPAITFVQGVASSVSIAEFVSDPDMDPLSITKNDVVLPPGVSYDAAGRRFVYDGVGAVGATDGHVLVADDGQGA